MKKLFVFLSLVMATNMWAPSVKDLIQGFQSDASGIVEDVEDDFYGAPAAPKVRPSIPKKPVHLSAKVKAQQAVFAMKKKKPVPTPRGVVPLSKRKKRSPLVKERLTDAITLEPLKKDFISLECGHKFNHEGIKKWMTEGGEDGSGVNSCPMCRKQMTLNDIDAINPQEHYSVADFIAEKGMPSTSYNWLDLGGAAMLGGKKLTDLTGLDQIVGIGNVITLKIGSNALRKLGPNAFTVCPKLNKLELGGNKIREMDKDAFSGLAELTYLDLSGNQLSTLVSNGFQPLTALNKLDLAGNPIHSIKEDAFNGLAELTYLDLNQTAINHLAEGAFVGMSNKCQITMEDLTGTVNKIKIIAAFVKTWPRQKLIEEVSRQKRDSPSYCTFLEIYDAAIQSLNRSEAIGPVIEKMHYALEELEQNIIQYWSSWRQQGFTSEHLLQLESNPETFDWSQFPEGFSRSYDLLKQDPNLRKDYKDFCDNEDEDERLTAMGY